MTGFPPSTQTLAAGGAAPSAVAARRAVAQILLLAAVFLILWPTTRSLFDAWSDTDATTYTHGFLVAAIAAWLLFRNRDELAGAAVNPSVAAAVALFGAGIAWLVSVRAGIQTLHQLLLPICAWLVIYAAFGRQIAARSVVAIGYLYFAIPFWGAFNDLLQAATVAAVALLLDVTGVVAFVHGNRVDLAAGTFEIAGGCSGLHFFIVALALAVLYGEINRDSLKVRAQLVVLATVLALITNWVRVYTIILAGYLTDMQHYLVRVEHYRYGWLVFAFAMVGFFFIARRLPAAERQTTSVPASGSIEPTLAPVGVAIALSALGAAPLWNLISPVEAGQLASEVSFPPVRGFQPETGDTAAWQPVFQGADAVGQQGYRRHDGHVQVFGAWYAYQTQDKELVGYHNAIAGRDANIVSQSRRQTPLPLVEVVASDGTRRAVIWYFYDVGGWRTNRGVAAQIRYGASSLWSNPSASVVAVRAECAADCKQARVLLEDFFAAAEFL